MSEPSTSPHEPLRRVSGKPVAIGVLILLAIGVGSAVSLWFRGRVPSGPIAAVEGMDQDHALLLRQGFEERGYTHLVYWRYPDGQRWSEALFGVQDPAAMARLGGLGLVRVTEARGNPSLHAFDLETGEFRWRGPYPEPERVNERVPFRGDPLHTTDDVAFEIIGGDPVEVLVVDVDGALVAAQSLDAGPGPQSAQLEGDALVVDTGAGWFRVGADGQAAPTEARDAPAAEPAASGETCVPARAGGVVWSCRDADVIRR